jgi:hypothetical protein
MHRLTGILLAILAPVLATTCATPPVRTALSREAQAGQAQAGQASTLSPAARVVQQKLVEGARLVVDRQDLAIDGRKFAWDCTGTVCAIYWHAGIDLAASFPRYAGNGVERLYRTLEARRLLYESLLPAAGDIVFWDNTWDANGDGKWNDPLTHVGMVVETSREGAVSYVHLHHSRGVVIEPMSLREPGVYQRTEGGRVRVVNAPMRLATPGKPHPAQWLAGQLFRVLGMGYLLKLP